MCKGYDENLLTKFKEVAEREHLLPMKVSDFYKKKVDEEVAAIGDWGTTIQMCISHGGEADFVWSRRSGRLCTGVQSLPGAGKYGYRQTISKQTAFYDYGNVCL